jgi:hypothetical protein
LFKPTPVLAVIPCAKGFTSRAPGKRVTTTHTSLSYLATFMRAPRKLQECGWWIITLPYGGIILKMIEPRCLEPVLNFNVHISMGWKTSYK